jgi:hypothetical protein
MDNTQIEVKAIEQAIIEAIEAKVRELDEFHLAMVGGGFGDTVI